jgi:hypothetical protein
MKRRAWKSKLILCVSVHGIAPLENQPALAVPGHIRGIGILFLLRALTDNTFASQLGAFKPGTGSMSSTLRLQMGASSPPIGHS